MSSSLKGSIMNFDEFLTSIDDERPPLQLSETLTSLWWDKKGDWNVAHAIAQKIRPIWEMEIKSVLEFNFTLKKHFDYGR